MKVNTKVSVLAKILVLAGVVFCLEAKICGITISPSDGFNCCVAPSGSTNSITVTVAACEDGTEPTVSVISDTSGAVSVTKDSYSISEGTGTWIGHISGDSANTLTITATSGCDEADTTNSVIKVFEVNTLTIDGADVAGASRYFFKDSGTISVDATANPTATASNLPACWSATWQKPDQTTIELGKVLSVNVDKSLIGCHVVTFSAGSSAKHVEITIVDLITETEVISPTNINRTTIGVGEVVSVFLTPGISADWALSGDGDIGDITGLQTAYFAPEIAGDGTITASLDNETKQVKLTTISPIGILFEFDSFRDIENICPGQNADGIGVGWNANVYIQPDTVNFSQISLNEGACDAVLTGCWLDPGRNKPRQHDANTHGNPVSVVSGKGNKLSGKDMINYNALPPLNTNGTMTYPIEWTYGINESIYAITNIDQKFSLTYDVDTGVISFSGTKGDSGVSIGTPDCTPISH